MLRCVASTPRNVYATILCFNDFARCLWTLAILVFVGV